MAQWKEGDRVRVVTRPVLAEDRRSHRYFDHMAGNVGVITTIYGPEEVAVQIDKSSLSPITAEVHAEAERRLRAKAKEKISSEGASSFTPEELEFDTHFVLLVRAEDLEKA